MHVPCPADRPYDRLQALPRGVWLGSLIASAGTPERRLVDTRNWLDALQRGELPPADADFGDPAASAPLREAVGDLGLPGLARATPALAEQVLRTLLWHLDRIVDLQPALSHEAAIQAVADDFRAAWKVQTHGLDDDLALLLGLGDFAHLRWDALQGHLRSRPWAAARRASEWLRQLPALGELVRQLGRSERDVAAPPAPAADPARGPAPPAPLRAIETRLPGAPGEITGVRFSSRLEQMLASEAVMLKHPLLKKLWRARHAEARLLSWDTTAVLTDWRPDPHAATRAPSPPPAPEPLVRGPIILCLDTSGSMRGAPENIAKAVTIAALRAAHEQRRGCLLVAFGGPGEIVEHELGRGADGLDALMALMGQGFDGGTDIQTPIERAIERVHESRWRSADLLVVSDGEFGCVPATLARLDDARERFGLRVQGVLVGDRETMGLLEVCDAIHWVRDWRRYADAAEGGDGRGFSPVHSKSLTALYFPNALSSRAARHQPS
ncbi:VWA domain-containing protein [Ideonella sp.]|uniref:VWA domain-containing protein n=1 Tax=Ideonella sp. TaxID=1929293 RepID=UPI002B45A835|nr:VWA domain-containing protein [Ideonella sp.]HJV71864.1 VWA domain-containing protein [Ideonella sp.]